MKTRTKTLFCIASFTIAASAALWAAEPATTPPEGSTPAETESAKPVPAGDDTATCLLKITSDPAVLPLELEIVDSVMHSSGVKSEAIKATLGEAADVQVSLELFSSGPMEGPNTAPVAPGRGFGGYGGPGTGPTALPAPDIVPQKPAGAKPMGGMMMGGMGGGGVMANPFSGPVTVSLPAGREQMLIGRLTISSPEKGHAREIMSAVTQRFQQTLDEVGSQEKTRLTRDLETTQRQVAEAQKQMEELQKMRQAMSKDSPFADLSRESILDMTRRFESERQDTAVKVQTLQARQDAIRKQLAEGEHRAAAAAQDTLASDPAFAPAEAKLAELKKALEEMAKAGGPQRPEVKRTEQEIQAVQAEIAARKQQLARSTVGRHLGELNDQMAAMSIDLAEAEARMQILETKCQEMRNLLGKADDYELRVSMPLPMIKAAFENAYMRSQELRARISAIRPPTVTVIGG